MKLKEEIVKLQSKIEDLTEQEIDLSMSEKAQAFIAELNPSDAENLNTWHEIGQAY